MSSLKLNLDHREVTDEIDSYLATHINFMDSVHPELIKLLVNAKSNNKFLSGKAYLNQNKISFDCVSKVKKQGCILIDKKAS